MFRFYELLARNLDCSKTEARRLIEEGDVEDEAGQALRDARRVVTAPLVCRVGGEPLTLRENVLVAQHKPTGVITALRDDRHPVAFDLLDGAPLHALLRPVGRLDLETSGLLLWTTDGALLQRLTHPKRAVPRTYHAALAGPFGALPPNFTLEDGHQPQITALQPLSAGDAHPALQVPDETACLATVTIVGGAYHEVRRIFAALGSHVLGLCRISFGAYHLPVDFAAGSHREIDPSELVSSSAR